MDINLLKHSKLTQKTKLLHRINIVQPKDKAVFV